MDLRKIKKLIELLEDSALVEMEITEGDSTIRLSRSGVVAPPITAQPMTQTMVSTGPGPADNVAEPPPTVKESTGKTVDSPMVGTFYDAPSPDAEPYVTVGSQVKPGDVLCVIEAMKTFNQLEADTSGTIKAIYKSVGDPVEFGEPLFLID